MYQYKILKVLKLKGSRLHVVVDLGFNTQVNTSFELGRVDEPELDFNSATDPEVAMRSFIIQWIKTAPRPLYVHTDKEKGDYVGEVFDRNGRNLADDLAESNDSSEQTQVIDYALPQATSDPTGF